MKIKHIFGYGNVNATKISEKTVTTQWGEKIKEIKIRVEGNHERGIKFEDYDAFNWLVKKHFGKGYEYNNLITFYCNPIYNNGIDTCEYTFGIEL